MSWCFKRREKGFALPRGLTGRISDGRGGGEQASRCYPLTSKDNLKDLKCEKNCSPPMALLSVAAMCSYTGLFMGHL